jgi:hypothetical protein
MMSFTVKSTHILGFKYEADCLAYIIYRITHKLNSLQRSCVFIENAENMLLVNTDSYMCPLMLKALCWSSTTNIFAEYMLILSLHFVNNDGSTL